MIEVSVKGALYWNIILNRKFEIIVDKYYVYRYNICMNKTKERKNKNMINAGSPVAVHTHTHR